MEARHAAEVLGADRVLRLELEDGAVDSAQESLTTQLVEAVGDGRGTVIVAPWRRDGHPDHEAAGHAAAAAARRTGADLWEYPVWFWHWGSPDEAPWPSLHPWVLDEELLGIKGRAIRAHASQVAPLSALEGDETLLTEEMLAHFEDGPEHYLRTPSAECPDDSLDRCTRRRRTRGERSRGGTSSASGTSSWRCCHARTSTGPWRSVARRARWPRRWRRAPSTCWPSTDPALLLRRPAAGSRTASTSPWPGSTCHTTGPRTPLST